MVDYDLCFCGDIYAQTPSRLVIGEDLRKLFNRCRHIVTNLETPIVSNPLSRPMNKYSALKTTKEIVGFLKEAKVTAASLANNHIMDYGSAEADNTVNILNKNSILNYGYGKTIEESLAPKKLKVDDRAVALIGVTTTFAPEALAKKKKPGVAGVTVITRINVDPREVLEEPAAPYIVGGQILLEDLRMLKAVFEDAKKENDYVIVQVHWGVGLAPYNEVVLDYVKDFGRQLIDFGADAVVGGHPHTIQPMEAYKKKPIMYSLGNFVFHPIMNGMENKGLVLAMSLEGHVVDLYFLVQQNETVDLLGDLKDNPKIQFFKYQSSKSGLRLMERENHIGVSL
jgi:poly-gamma-glutamate synthesis protein (capsule biosynthesis protein)